MSKKWWFSVVVLVVVLLVVGVFFLFGSVDRGVTGGVISEVSDTEADVVLDNGVNDIESFNLEVVVPFEYQRIAVGQTLWFTTKVLNLANKQRVDVVLVYRLVDASGEVRVSRSETVAVETQASFVGHIELPVDLAKGEYELVVEMVSDTGQSVEGSTKVSLVYPDDLQGFFMKYGWWLLAAFILLVLLVLLSRLKPFMVRVRKRRQSKSRIKQLIQRRVASKKVTREELRTSKLPKPTPTSVGDQEKIF